MAGVDLPTPTDLWSSWSRLAAALGALGYDDVWWTTADGHAHHDDHGGSHQVLVLVEGGRAVLHGWDRDATFDREDVTRSTPPVDLFAGAPGWLPFTDLHALAVEEQLGWLFWFEPGTGWARAPYPDGVDDGSSRMLAEVIGGFEDVLADWAQDEDERARAEAATPVPPTWFPAGTEDRPAPLVMTVEEQHLLAEAAARAGYEKPRPVPAPSRWLEEVTTAVRRAVPRGSRGSVTAWVGEGSASMSGHGVLSTRDVDLFEPLRELQRAEGFWTFVAVVADDSGVHVWRAYDTVPPWWKRGRFSFPDLPSLREIRSRDVAWQPDWADLLEVETRTVGVPARFTGLARRVLGRECVSR
jgi:hypothetical protein